MPPQSRPWHLNLNFHILVTGWKTASHGFTCINTVAITRNTEGILWTFVLTENHKSLRSFMNKAPVTSLHNPPEIPEIPFSSTVQQVLPLFFGYNFIKLFRIFVLNLADSEQQGQKQGLQAILILN